MIKLIRPCLEYEEDILLFKQEKLEHDGEAMDGCGSLERFTCFDDWQTHLNSYADRNTIKPDSDYVEGSQHMLVDEDRHHIIGMVNIRHYLNDRLLKTSGHIGYSIRPSERRKGYGKLQLKLALQFIKDLGVKEVLITCDEDNIASAKTIESCGGELEGIVFVPEFNCMVKRYWIKQ